MAIATAYAAARSVFRSTPVRNAASQLGSYAKPSRSPLPTSSRIPLSHRFFRSPVEMSACLESMQPYHTATAPALMTSMLTKWSRHLSTKLPDASKQTRFPKQRRGRMKGISHRGNHTCFGKYALQALEPAWITYRQIEAGRRAITRNARLGGKIWARIFPYKPITGRPTETRMGRGKGSLKSWVAVVKSGRILFEMSGITENIARRAISIAASKMPIRTQFVISG